MQTEQLWAVSPLDGRYREVLGDFGRCAGEGALIERRLEVEIRWILWLDERLRGALFSPLEPGERTRLEACYRSVDPLAWTRIKALESETRHDVKAVELFLRETTARESYGPRLAPFWHFACTSEDINNLAYALIWRMAQEKFLLPALAAIRHWLGQESRAAARLPMLSRTHGQPATPTTMGKELANFAYRLGRAQQALEHSRFSGKFNGAVGNYNAHVCALPEIDWISLSRDFVSSFGLEWNPLTTQIEPHDQLAAWLDAISRTNTILLDLCRDFWGYIAIDYFRQRAVAGEVGSSTMPHKINPIWFENAEGNLGLANAILRHLAEKLPISRFQRDLSDSTAQRNVASGIGHTLLSWRMIREGLSRIAIHPETIQQDLDRHPEVLGEAVQTLLRHAGMQDAYERIKDLMRGRNLDQATFTAWLHEAGLPPAVQQQLEQLTPGTYIGLAPELAEKLDDFLEQTKRHD